jgi:hypothetical protein
MKRCTIEWTEDANVRVEGAKSFAVADARLCGLSMYDRMTTPSFSQQKKLYENAIQ